MKALLSGLVSFTAALAIAFSIALATAPTASGASFECRWCDKPPVIDGVLDEEAWQGAQVIDSFRMPWMRETEQPPATKTKARLLWDREYLYFSAEMEDWDVFANVTEQDGSIWLNDVFELFFKPDASKLGYYEFEVNAANGKLDMFLPSRGAGSYQRFAKEVKFHVESAVSVNGTLNKWQDRDKGWVVEGRIPWSDFSPTGGRPLPNEVWQHALCRYDYSVGLERPSLSTTAKMSRPDFHLYEDYVPLLFVGPKDLATAKAPRWDGAKLKGYPEAEPAFRTVNAFPKLKTKFPITVRNEPGKNGFLLLETSGYTPVRESRFSRLPNDPEATEPQLLLNFEETVFDFCFHPDFLRNGYVYFGSNARIGEDRMDFNNRLLRYTMNMQTGTLDPSSRLVLLEWYSQGHNGLSLDFGRDGMLYLTSGDGTSDSDEWDVAQDLSKLYSKVLRLDVDHPDPDKAYGIPKDNPFVQTPGARGETWCYGFRNPWRMSVDRETGDIWVGENGQDLWEYARIVRRGENYGWPLVEGNHPYQENRKKGPTPISKALVEHSHSEFRSLTGGLVYRGSKFPELAGSYVYGDYSTGQIWAAKQERGVLVSDTFVSRSRLAITNFCETPAGDLLVVDYSGHAIHRMVRTPPAEAAAQAFPRKLSETGLFADTAAHKPQTGVVSYEVNAPAWHDGAEAQHFFAVPSGGAMEVTDRGGWKLPNGSALVQTLTREGKRLETRVMLRQDNEWAGYSYAWDAAQKDATLTEVEGRTTEEWRYPSRAECMVCHSRQAGFVLSLNTAQLNRRGAEGRNQLEQWERLSLLIGKLNFEKEFTSDTQRQTPEHSPLLSVPPDSLKRLVDPLDVSASLTERARSYLHVNCAHCHAANAGGNSPMQLGFEVKQGDMGIINTIPVHSTFGVSDARIVAPGAPERSMLLYRPALRGTGQMPPVGSLRADPAAAGLLVEWIKSLQAE